MTYCHGNIIVAAYNGDNNEVSWSERHDGTLDFYFESNGVTGHSIQGTMHLELDSDGKTEGTYRVEDHMNENNYRDYDGEVSGDVYRCYVTGKSLGQDLDYDMPSDYMGMFATYQSTFRTPSAPVSLRKDGNGMGLGGPVEGVELPSTPLPNPYVKPSLEPVSRPNLPGESDPESRIRETARGVGQVALNALNGVTDTLVGLANTAIDATPIGQITKMIGSPLSIDAPDWSYGLAWQEPEATGWWTDTHGWSKFGGGVIIGYGACKAGSALNGWWTKTPKSVKWGTTERKLQHEFSSHAKDFGINGNWNKQNAEAFKNAIQNHLNNPNTKTIKGTYRGNIPVTHHYDPKTGLNVMLDANGNLVGSWKLAPKQIKCLFDSGNIQ